MEIWEVAKKHPEVLQQMNTRPWAWTIGKFNEVFKKFEYQIKHVRSASGKSGYYALFYKDKAQYRLISVARFFKEHVQGKW